MFRTVTELHLESQIADYQQSNYYKESEWCLVFSQLVLKYRVADLNLSKKFYNSTL